MFRWISRVFVSVFIAGGILMSALSQAAEDNQVFVCLGFHASFYHSWRGDTPDEAGFGTDIRVVRGILDILDQANAEGLEARGYWDWTIHWTVEQIIPEYAPDIIERIKRRVDEGLDEILVGPYNNGLNSAATDYEFRHAVGWAVENPFGSGLKQVFGRVTPIYRPQESMLCPSQIPVLLDEGMEGVILGYTTIPFTTYSNFVPVLSVEDRFNAVWLKDPVSGERIVSFHSVTPGDLVNFISMEKWLVRLHEMQTSGEVNRDLIIHINFDADAETWLPMDLTKALEWFPNARGLYEYIDTVNKYDWAHFTTPGEYLAEHPPEKEITVYQDMADGAYDGHYSWSEKHASTRIWSRIERSRLYSQQAEFLAGSLGGRVARDIHGRLYEGTSSSFYNRLIGLATTHFGMSCPIVNEEREEKADMITGRAESAAREARDKAFDKMILDFKGSRSSGEEVYVFSIFDYPGPLVKDGQGAVTRVVRTPVILDDLSGGYELKGAGVEGFSIINPERLKDGRIKAELLFGLAVSEGKTKEIRLVKSESPLPRAVAGRALSSSGVEMDIDPSSGPGALRYNGRDIGGKDFIRPFITYKTGKRPRTYYARDWQVEDLSEEYWSDGITRSRLIASIPVRTRHGVKEADLRYDFTVAPFFEGVLVDVFIDYPYTEPEDLLQTVQQKLRRLIDLRWIEVAPFQMNLGFTADADKPFKVWKQNYQGIISYYEMNYGDINPKNRNLESFNHQITAGWAAVTNRNMGLLIAENCESDSLFAFLPMRLREKKGVQHLSLNPFGSYYGKQMDYTHLGGNGLGTEITMLAASQLKPNGPSYNGRSQAFRLMLIPYSGDEPPERAVIQANSYFYPPGVIYLKTPSFVHAVSKNDVMALVEESRLAFALENTSPLDTPRAFLANPSDRAADLVWDPALDPRITGYKLDYRTGENEDWLTREVPPGKRFQVEGLENGETYYFRLKAVSKTGESDYTNEAVCVPGPVKEVPVLSIAKNIRAPLVAKLVKYLALYFTNPD